METSSDEHASPTATVPSQPSGATWLTAADWIEVARLMLTSRAIDHIEETDLFPSGKITYQFSARGHELAQILLSFALSHPLDAATVYYRSRPFLLGCGLSPEQALASSLGRAGSVSGGRDVGVIFSMPPREAPRGPRRGRAIVFPAVGDVGGQYSPAAGWAQAINYRKKVLKETEWRDAMAVALGGDGSVATNGFWSSLTLITTLNLPCLLYIEDNAYATSVPNTIQTPGGNIAENLASFKNLTIIDCDGTDPVGAATAIAKAVSLTKAGSPCLLHLSIVRLQGHSVFDNQVYRSPEAKARDEARDPLPRLRAFLVEKGFLTASHWTSMEEAVREEVAAARDAALAQPEPDPGTARHYTFYEPGRLQLIGGVAADPVVSAQNRSATMPPASSAVGPLSMRSPAAGPMSTRGPSSMRGVESMAPLTLNAAIKKTLESELKVNPKMLIFGQDVAVMGGLYGTTTSLHARFGQDRVFDTSLSEDGIIGRSIGMAYAGLLPVSEIQCRKYADAGTEQINNAGTVRWRTAGRFAAPMVIRIPCGIGKLTGDPWHALTAESVFAHSVGLRIAFPSNAEDAVGLLRSALRGNDPTIFLEHRALLYHPGARRYYPGEEYVVPFGMARTIQRGSELTIVTWGEAIYRVLGASENFWERVEVIDLRSIMPWDKQHVLDSVRKTHKCLIVHEDTFTCGFGAEIAATIAQEAFMDLEAPVIRLATSDQPVPYNQSLMAALSPSTESIKREIENLLDY